MAEPIAIIGAGCRFPRASDRPSKLWELLQQPQSLAEEIPSDRFNAAAFYHPVGTRGGSTNVKEAYFINDRNVRHFDAQFFSFPPAEAEAIDPQHRHLLEVVYEALEEAGLTIDGLQGSNTACYVGQMCNDFSALSSRDFDHIPKYSAPGIAPSNASSRVSYFFDWHGPTITIDTACSSSLIALAQAVQTLRAGTSDVAIAAGTNLILDPLAFISESNLGMLSPTGRSRMWDAAADGYARGDGVAAVVLKTVRAALRDGDTIDCIVREVGCNHDGRTRGITMPSGAAQAALIRDTYARAGLDPTLPTERCQYFEAHGTGTPAGDPQEASALAAAFFPSSASASPTAAAAAAAETPESDEIEKEKNESVETVDGQDVKEDILYVGSIKTVIGHTEGTAGLAGILKAALALKHAVIPPNLLLEQVSPSVLPHMKHLRIVKEATAWPQLEPGVPRRASVNSFGFGGSNAHAILEAYEPAPAPEPEIESKPSVSCSLVPLVFSAASEKSLVNQVSSYVSHLRQREEGSDNGCQVLDLDHLRHTLACRRSALPVKATFSGLTVTDLISKMDQQVKAFQDDDDGPTAGKTTGSPATFGGRSLAKPSILGVFTGQGAQWATMGADLIATHERARHLVAQLDACLQSLPAADRPNWKILDELSKDKASSRIGEAVLSQPLCTAVQLVLVDLLVTAGIRFAAVVGHSSGEIAAAHAAGFLTPQDAIRIAYYRGFHAKCAGSGSDNSQGAMLAVGTTMADAQDLCELEDVEGKLCVAASNSPSSVTLSGDVDAIELAKAAFDEEGKFTRRLAVDTAYHSHHMQAPAQAFEQSLAQCGVTPQQPPTCTANGDASAPAPVWVSSVRERTVVTLDDFGESLRGSYWAENMVQMVRFSQAIEFAVETCVGGSATTPFNLAIEVGPHPALKKPALETLEAAGVKTVEYIGTLARGKDDVSAVADCLGAAWVRLGSAAVNWARMFACYYHALDHSHSDDPTLGTNNKNNKPLPVLRDLPLYSWDHGREFWSESRVGKLFRTGHGGDDQAIHELLGKKLPEGTVDELRWKTVLDPSVTTWLPGHALQGQTVYPAAGYVCLAMEAAMEVVNAQATMMPVDRRSRTVQCIELADLEIHKAIAIDERAGTDMYVSVTDIQSEEADVHQVEASSSSTIITARFCCRSPLDKESGRLARNASGRLTITITTVDNTHAYELEDDSPLVPREQTYGRLAEVDLEQFYEALSALGYGYSGVFRGLSRLQRRLGFASGTIDNPSSSTSDTSSDASSLHHALLLFHPAVLDVAIHSLFSSFGVPGDGTWSLQVPSRIRRVTLVPRRCGHALPSHVDFDCTMSSLERQGNIDILAADGINKAMEIDGLEFVPFAPFTEKDDKCLFSKVTWQLFRPDGDKVGSHLPTEWDNQKVVDRERVAFYYLRTLRERAALPSDPHATTGGMQTVESEENLNVQTQKTMKTEDMTAEKETASHSHGHGEEEANKVITLMPPTGFQPHHQSLLDFADMCTNQVAAKKDPIAIPEWMNDTSEQIMNLMAPYGNDPDFNIMRAVGENMPLVMRGEMPNILEVMTKDNMLADFYSHGLGGQAANSAVALMLQQITNRFPHIDILEVGAGTGGATWEIMSRNTPFATYTYTDVSAAFFEKAAVKFARYTDRMIFKVFDMERAPGEQGLVENKYDVVIGSHCLHATRSLENTLTNLRRLLKPGGFLVVLEVVQIDTMPLGLIMGGLPGWWAGRDDGRIYGPNVTLPRWNKLLKKTGFAGVDTFTPMLNPRLHTASIFCAQAVDDGIHLLRRPLASTPDDINFPHLVLVGGESLATSDLVEELEELLRPRCQVLVVIATLEELEDVTLPPLTAVLSLADLDRPVFQGLTEQRWKCLQRLLGSASCMLWLTHGARCEEPDSGTMLGLLQSIWYELEHLRSQLLEVVDLKDLKARFLAELILQMQVDQQWRKDARFDKDAVLYSIEPELMLDQGGVLKLLRQKPDQAANNRYNSARRVITKEVDLNQTRVAVQWQQDVRHHFIREVKGDDVHVSDDVATDQCRRRVQLSTLFSVQTVAGPLFLSLGVEEKKNSSTAKVLALSHENTSTISAPNSIIVTAANVVDDAIMTDHEYLTLATAYIVSQFALCTLAAAAKDSSPFDSPVTLLLHEPPAALAAILSHHPGLNVFFTSSHSSHKKRVLACGQSPWLHVHPRSPIKALRKILPKNVDIFVDFSTPLATMETLAASKISQLLSKSCKRLSTTTLFDHEAREHYDGHDLTPKQTLGLAGMLKEAHEFVSHHAAALVAILRESPSIPTLPVANIALGTGMELSMVSPLTLQDWGLQVSNKKDNKFEVLVPTTIEPIDTPRDLFQRNKTYWLVGLSGDLGQSLVDWMAAHGATHIVISSRRVKNLIPSGWIDAHAENGVTIKLIVNDVTDMDSLRTARTEIERTMPPIRGVANGALVLRDRLFINTDFDVFNEVLRPKTVGTANLHALFHVKDELDWFIGFTSIVAVVGNYGQSAYSAGNNYIKALINQRRAMGLPGATIDISTVRGVGYVEREQKAGVMTAKMVERIENGAMPMSERDLHQLFAEGIVAGRPEDTTYSSSTDIDQSHHRYANITSGIQMVRSDQVNRTFWANNLKFAHFVKEVGLAGSAGERGGSANRVSVRTLLAEATSMEQTIKIIRTAFTAKLNLTLQHPAEQTIPDTQALIDLGMDSLVAVEVRTWFRQELALDMPMLKILGGATMIEMVEDAVSKLPRELVPKVPRPDLEDASVSAGAGESTSTDQGTTTTTTTTLTTALVSAEALSVLPPDESLLKAENAPQHQQEHHHHHKAASSSGSESEKPTSESSGPSATSATTYLTTPAIDTANVKDMMGFQQDVTVRNKKDVGVKEGKDSTALAIIPSSFKPDIQRTEPMSYGQSRFWFLRQYLDDPATTNVTFYFRITSAFNASGLREALARSCQRHEALRTCFFVKDDSNNTPVQGIMSKSTIQMEHYPVRSHSEAHGYFTALTKHHYALEQGDTLRLILCEESPTSWYFILGYHHIVMDGFSWEILFAELQSYYRGGYIPPVTRQYTDWALRQRSDVTGGLALASARKYWRDHFATLPPVLPLLPMAKVAARTTLQTYDVHRTTSVTVPLNVVQHIRQAAQQAKATPFHVHLAVFRTLLFRLTGENDLCIGMADAGRSSDPADANIIGLLLDLLPLRLHLKRNASSPSLATTLRDVRTAVYAAVAHAGVPFQVLLDDVGALRSTAWHPLVQALIEYRPARRVEFAGIRGEVPPGETTAFAKGPYDVELNILEGYDGAVTVSIGLQSALYSAEAADLVLRCYMTLLESVTQPGNEERGLNEAEMWPRQDTEAALGLGTADDDLEEQGDASLSSRITTLPHCLDGMTRRYPDRVATKDTLGVCLSYQAMSDRVNTIQTALHGQATGATVAVLLPPSVDWACALMAILRSGMVYVPLDCNQGSTRLQQIVHACSPSAFIVDSSSLSNMEDWQLNSVHAAIVNLTDFPVSSTTCTSRPENLADPNKAAVILFTSGTTGTPKGTLLQHGALANVTQGMLQTLGLASSQSQDNEPQIVLQQSALSFDMSLEQLFLAWGVGGTALIADASIRGDSPALMKVAVDEGVTLTKATPPEYVSWLRHGSEHVRQNATWKTLIAGGDRMTSGIKNDLRSLGKLGGADVVVDGDDNDGNGMRLFNSYGPAEATIIATMMELHENAETKQLEQQQPTTIPTGHPLPGYSIHIVDTDLNLLPPGISGEILIGGGGVAMGYVGLDEQETARLNKEAFVPNPWASPAYQQKGWTRLYRTGDRGHLTPDGALVFDGRMAGDTQVKLRGMRLELRDIEANIVRSSQGALSEAVCSLRGNDEAKFIVAHIVFTAGADHQDKDGSHTEAKDPDNEEQEEDEEKKRAVFLKELRDRLPVPPYMKPARLIPVSTILLTAHGKIDRSAMGALPLVTTDNTLWSTDDDRALTECEGRLAAIWERLLPREALPSPLSPSADFFMLGGNSLMLVEVQAHIRADLGVDVSLRDLYQNVTLVDLAAKVDELMAVREVDWEAETVPPRLDNLVVIEPEILEETRQQQQQQQQQQKGLEVILTGSTGHLGPYILRRLLSNPDISMIHCLAVRDAQKLQILIATTAEIGATAASERITIHPGDLTLPDLGLDIVTFTRLAKTVAVIIHAGAARLSWETYDVLRPVNLHPTHALLRLAGPRRIPFHFVSSGGVLPAGQMTMSLAEATSAAAYVPPRLGADGYIASKWASERMLERAAAAAAAAAAAVVDDGTAPTTSSMQSHGLGVPVRIYRTVRCAAAANENGEEQSPASIFSEKLPEDIAAGMATASVESMTMLDHGGYAWSGWFDLVSVHEVAGRIYDSVAKDLLWLSSSSSSSSSSTQKHITYTNIPGTYRVWKVNQLHQLVLRPEIQANMGKFKMVPPQIWLGVLKRSGFPWMMGASEATYKDWVSNRR